MTYDKGYLDGLNRAAAIVRAACRPDCECERCRYVKAILETINETITDESRKHATRQANG